MKCPQSFALTIPPNFENRKIRCVLLINKACVLYLVRNLNINELMKSADLILIKMNRSDLRSKWETFAFHEEANLKVLD